MARPRSLRRCTAAASGLYPASILRAQQPQAQAPARWRRTGTAAFQQCWCAASVRRALAATAEDFLRLFPDGDISYQLKFAVDYVRDGSITDWVLNLWPPGMPVLNGLILKLGGSNYFPLKIISLSTLLYALASYMVYQSLARGRFSPSFLVVCVLPLMFLTFLDSIFLGINLFSSDKRAPFREKLLNFLSNNVFCSTERFKVS